ncbi:hypothetical protein J2Z43_000290 [Clostridioides mangenotii]|uniref:Uncharacterized protein n=1 Tax=Metaclostridioides mangenotii TaxID=1540 RepID=A0ABS4E7H5_9FIRM|nr:hypothetical protein [Clostridioides mangenotii]
MSNQLLYENGILKKDKKYLILKAGLNNLGDVDNE